MLEVVDVVPGELDAGQLEELRPADPVDPLAHALELLRVLGVDVDDVHDRVHDFGPPGRVVRQERDGQLGELRRRARVAHLAADPDRDAVVLGVVERHRRADGVAVAAVHALRGFHRHAVLAVHCGRPDGPGRARGDQRRHLAGLRQRLVVWLRRFAVNAQDRDVGAVHGAAHIQAAGQRDAELGRQVLVREPFVERVHDAT